MILAAYIIGGQNAASIGKFYTSDLNGNDPFKLVDTLPAGYADVTSVSNLYNFGANTGYDYKKIRDEIKGHVISIGNDAIVSTETDPTLVTPLVGNAYIIGVGATGDWLNRDNQVALWNGSAWEYFEGVGISTSLEEYGFTFLNATEKQIAAGYLIGSIGQQIAAFGADPVAKENAQGYYNKNVTDCRYNRYLWAQTHFMNHIPANAAEVVGVIESNSLDSRYIKQGIFGMVEFDDIAPGICDYIDGVGAWAGTGIRQKSWTTLYGQDMNAFCDAIKDVLFYVGVV